MEKSMKKKLIFTLIVILGFTFCIFNNEYVYAEDQHKYIEGSIELDTSSLQIGDSIVVYENKNDDYKVVVDVIECDYLNTTRDIGNSGWSDGTIPLGTYTLKPHIEKASLGLQYAGFTEKVKLTSKEITILEVHSEDITCGIELSISNVKLSIINKSVSGSVSAKASMTWLSHENGLNSSYNCYLTSEINSNSQHRISWKF